MPRNSHDECVRVILLNLGSTLPTWVSKLDENFSMTTFVFLAMGRKKAQDKVEKQMENVKKEKKGGRANTSSERQAAIHAS